MNCASAGQIVESFEMINRERERRGSNLLEWDTRYDHLLGFFFLSCLTLKKLHNFRKNFKNDFHISIIVNLIRTTNIDPFAWEVFVVLSDI